MTTALHEDRLAAVIRAVEETGARTVLDLGCGTGDLILRLAMLPGITRITGIDTDLDALRLLQTRLADLPGDARARVQIAQASMTRRIATCAGTTAPASWKRSSICPPAISTGWNARSLPTCGRSMSS